MKLPEMKQALIDDVMDLINTMLTWYPLTDAERESLTMAINGLEKFKVAYNRTSEGK